jgi:hypothetical protein
MPSRVDIKEKRWVLDDFFKVEEAHLSFERFDGTMSPVVRRLNFERGDSVAAMLHPYRTRYRTSGQPIQIPVL